jgi:DNA-binding CsgD family transcriptional regulator
VTDRHYPSDGWERLTLTELAAAKFVCDGLAEDVIARRLNMAPTLARALVNSVFAKLGVVSRVELVIQAVQRHDLT